MELYRDFDVVSSGSDSENNNSSLYRDKSSQLRHKSTNTFVFESFNTKLSKLKIRFNENIDIDFTSNQFQNEKFYYAPSTEPTKDGLTISDKFSNFQSLLEREKALNGNLKQYAIFAASLNQYSISFVYLVNNYKKVLDILYDSIENELNEVFKPIVTNDKTVLNFSFLKSCLDLLVALIKDVRSECFDYFIDKNLPQVIKVLNTCNDNVEMIDHIFGFFVNMFKIFEKSIQNQFEKVLFVYSEILFNKNRFIRKFAAQSLCFIIKNLPQDELIKAFEFLFDIIEHPNKIFEEEDIEMDNNDNANKKEDSKCLITKTINDTISNSKMFLIECVSELFMEVLSNGKIISIKADIIINKLKGIKSEFINSYIMMLVYVSAFVKLLKRVNEKNKLNVIVLFIHYIKFIYEDVNDSNYQKMKNEKILTQIQSMQIKSNISKIALLIFSKEILSKNFKESNSIYAECANEILNKIINENKQQLTQIERTLMIEITVLIQKFFPQYISININNLFESESDIEYYLSMLLNLQSFYFYQKFSLFKERNILKKGNNVINENENPDYANIKYNKDNIMGYLDSLINDNENHLEIITYKTIVNIITTYRRLFVDDDNLLNDITLTNPKIIDNIIQYIKKNINKNTLNTWLNDLNVEHYSNVDSLLMIIGMLGEIKRNVFQEEVNHIRQHSIDKLNTISIPNNNNELQFKLINVLLNEFYCDNKYYLDKSQGYLNIIRKCMLLDKSNDITNNFLQQIKHLSAYGLYYLITNSIQNKSQENNFDYIMLLSNNNKYKLSYLNLYTSYYRNKYNNDKFISIANDIFDKMYTILNIVFDYTKDKQYSINFEVIISKIEVILTSDGINEAKHDLFLFTLYFLLGSHWITLTKSVWAILQRAIERLFTYFINGINTKSYDNYQSIMEKYCISYINNIFSFIQLYSSESDFVSKTNINKQNTYIIFNKESTCDNVDLYVSNISYVLSTQNADQFKTISTFFQGFTTSLSTSFHIILNSNETFKYNYIDNVLKLGIIFNNDIDLYSTITDTNQFTNDMCLFYNYVLDKEIKYNSITLKLKENVFTILSKCVSLNSKHNEQLISLCYKQFILSRSVQIQKLSVDIISMIEPRIKSYVKLLYKVIETPTVLLELNNLEQITNDNSQLIKTTEREALIPIITRLYYSKYFPLLNSESNSKMKTKHKVNLVNYFIQLNNDEFNEYINIIFSPIENLNENNYCNFDLRTYSKMLTIIQTNLKQITRLFNNKIDIIANKIKTVFLFVKSFGENIKKNKQDIINNIHTQIQNSDISKTKYSLYYDNDELNGFCGVISHCTKDIKKETFKIFDKIFNMFYRNEQMVTSVSNDICKAYEYNLTKEQYNINSIYSFLISLSKHAKLHFIFRNNPSIIKALMRILSNVNTEKGFIVHIIEFIENILSVYEGTSQENANNNEDNNDNGSDDNEFMHIDDIPIDDETLKMNLDNIVLNNFDLINKSLSCLISNHKIQPSIKDNITVRVVDIFLLLWSLHPNPNGKSASCYSDILSFLLQIFKHDRAIFSNKDTLNQILKLVHILIQIDINVYQHTNSSHLINLYIEFISFIYKIDNFNSRLLLSIILHEFAQLLPSPSTTIEVLELISYLNSNKTTQREINSELDTEKVIEKLSIINEQFIIDHQLHPLILSPLIYQLLVLSNYTPDFAVSNLSLDKLKLICNFISRHGLQNEFNDLVINVMYDLMEIKFEYAKTILDVLNELNKGSSMNDLACGDLYNIKPNINEEDEDDNNLLTMLLHFKVDIRLDGIKLLKNNFTQITEMSIIKVIIPIIKNILDYKNYSEVPLKQSKKSKNEFNIKHKHEIVIDIINECTEILSLIVKHLQPNNNTNNNTDNNSSTATSVIESLLLFFYRNLHKIAKNKSNDNLYYSVDIFKMTTKALTVLIQNVIDVYFSNIQFDNLFQKGVDNIIKHPSNNEHTSINAVSKFYEIIEMISTENEVIYQTTKQQSDLYKTMTIQIYNTLKNILYDESKRENKHSYHIRNYIITPFLQISKIHPSQQTIQSQVVQLTIELVNCLSNIDAIVREQARNGIKNVLECYGEFFSLIFFENLKSQLHSGYQRHVLGYTVSYILSLITEPFLFEYSLPIIMPVLFDELFGDISEEKEVTHLVSKYHEAKHSKAIGSFELLGNKIKLSTLVLDVVFPLQKYLIIRHSDNATISRCNDVINAMVRGLKTNKTLNIDELLEYSYSLISIGIEQSIQNAKQIKSMKGIEIKGNDIYTVNVNVDYSIEIANEFIKEKNKIIYGNLFASFGCDFILIAIKNKMLATYENKGTKLNDVIVNVVQCLKLTNNTTIMSKAVKILISLFDMKLPIIKKNLTKITNTLFKNILSLNVKDILPCQSILSGISDILTRYHFITISNERIKTLLQFLKLNTNIPEIKPYVLSCFLSLLKRKIIHPDIYDMIKYLRELYLVSNEHNTMVVCSRIFNEFIMNYPMDNKVKMEHIHFFIVNVESKSRRCQLNSIKMLYELFENDSELIKEVVDFVVMKMFTIYTNSQDGEYKSLIENLFDKLFSKYTTKFEGYYSKAIILLKEGCSNNKEGMYILALNMISLIINYKEFAFIIKGRQILIDLLNKALNKRVKEFEKELDDKLLNLNHTSNNTNNNAVNIELKNWNILYYLLLILEKIILNYYEHSNELTLSFSYVIKTLNHPHSFIKTISLRILSYTLEHYAHNVDISITSLQNILSQLKFILLSTSYEDKLYTYITKIISYINNTPKYNGQLCHFLSQICNESKKWISNKAQGLTTLTRIIDIYELILLNWNNDISNCKPIIELCYRIINNNLADSELKKKSENIMQMIGERIEKDKLATIYKEVTKDISMLKQKRKMEQNELFKQKMLLGRKKD